MCVLSTYPQYTANVQECNALLSVWLTEHRGSIPYLQVKLEQYVRPVIPSHMARLCCKMYVCPPHTLQLTRRLNRTPSTRDKLVNIVLGLQWQDCTQTANCLLLSGYFDLLCGTPHILHIHSPGEENVVHANATNSSAFGCSLTPRHQ